jgi:hypothetical protein
LTAKSDDPIERIKNEISEFRRGGSKDDPKPHKLLMLLAVIDLLDEGRIQTNRIYFNEALIQSFERNFRHYSSNDDWCQPGPPYFHLRSSSFWFHHVKSNRQEQYAKLTTSGGGTKRILDNIDYAYFSDAAWAELSDPEARGRLRVFLTQRLDLETASWAKGDPMQTSVQSDSNRISNISFHESFPFYRMQVSKVLEQLALAPSDVDLSTGPKRKDYLRSVTQSGKRQALPMADYAFGGGLVNASYQLTEFGEAALAQDPLLHTSDTQWLIHYHLSAPQGPGHLFWHELVKRFFQSTTEFDASELFDYLSEVAIQITGKNIAESTIKKTRSVFISTYSNPHNLDNLGILEEVSPNRYQVLEPDPPSIWVFALALLDYWQAHYPTRQTINLDDLYIDGGLGDIFMMGGGRVSSYLNQLEQEGCLAVQSVAPPYQLALLQRDPRPLLENLYGHDRPG